MKKNSILFFCAMIGLTLITAGACSTLWDGGRREINTLPGSVKYSDFTSSVPELYAAVSDILEDGKLSEAEALYRQIISAEPDSPHGYVGLGTSLLYQDRLTEAQEAYTNATRRSPQTPYAYIGLGSVAYSRGDFQAAQQAYAVALELDETNADAHLGMGLALGELEQYDAAIEHLKLFLELAPDTQQRTSILALITDYATQ